MNEQTVGSSFLVLSVLLSFSGLVAPFTSSLCLLASQLYYNLLLLFGFSR